MLCNVMTVFDAFLNIYKIASALVACHIRLEPITLPMAAVQLHVVSGSICC